MRAAILFGLGQVGMGYDLSPSGVIQGQTMTHLKALENSDYFKLLAGIDNDLSRVNVARKHFKSFFAINCEEIHYSTPFELVTVATPTNSHTSVIAGIPQAMIPNVLLIEKPAGNSLDECLWIENWGERNSTEIYVNYFRRFLPESQKAKAFLSNLDLGELISIHINAYGTFLNIFSHFMDLGIFLSGRELFCDCEMKSCSIVESNLVHHCLSCDVRYSFDGLGFSKRECSAIISFSRYVIEISLDGRMIRIQDSSGLQEVAYSCSLADYLNYQRFVYLGLERNPNSDGSLSGLDQAIQIHAFIESLDLENV